MTLRQVEYARADDGVHIAFQVIGVGRHDILFIPGQITNIDIAWELPQNAAWLTALSRLGRVILVDRRGVGLSDRLSPGDLPTAEVLAEDIAAVMSAAAAPQPVLLGFAEGGQIASLFAASHPERVAGLITYGMWPSVQDEDIDAWESWIDRATKHWGSLDVAMEVVREVQPSRASDLAFVEFVARLHRGSLSPNAISPLIRTGLQLDVRDVLPAISVPTLVMHRERDSAADPSFLATVADLIPGARHVVLPGGDHWISAEPHAPMLDAIATFLEELDGHRAPSSRRLATILFTDIVGSTERAAALGDAGWTKLLTEHHDLVRHALARFGGREISTEGDGFFATFEGPAAAAACASEAVAAVRAIGLQIRAGVHTGEVETIDGEIGGLAVAIGARIGAIAGPSEVLVSQTVKDLVAGSGLVFADAGEHELKGVPDRWHLYRVVG